MSRPPSPRQAASRRLAQLGAVCRLHRREGRRPALTVWGPAIAQTLASALRSYALVDSAPKAIWPGLTQDSLRDALVRMGFEPTDQELAELLGRTAKHGKPVEAQLLGRLIGLTAAQRRTARAWSIIAVDQPRRLHEEESAERRREQNAKAQAAARRKSGAVSRQDYLESVRAMTPAGKTRNAVNVAACRERMKAGSSAMSSMALKAGSSAVMSTLLKAGSSASADMDVTGFVSGPIDIVPDGRPIGAEDAASDSASSIRRHSPALATTAAAGVAARQRAGGSPITASLEAGSAGIRKGLGDGCSLPESEALKKEPAQLGRTVPREDPREIHGVQFDREELAIALREIGDGDIDRGLARARRLSQQQLKNLDDELSERGAAQCEHAIALAKAAAMKIEAMALRRATT